MKVFQLKQVLSAKMIAGTGWFTLKNCKNCHGGCYAGNPGEPGSLRAGISSEGKENVEVVNSSAIKETIKY